MEAQKVALLTDHFPYEIMMLDETVGLLGIANLHPHIRNMAIESFWVHARNLVEFFTLRPNVDGTCSGVASARDFTDSGFRSDLTLGDLPDTINSQICHLRYERTSNVPEKLDGFDIQRVKAALDRDISKFIEHLWPDTRQFWNGERFPRPDVQEQFSNEP
jgi:hypothetical protein